MRSEHRGIFRIESHAHGAWLLVAMRNTHGLRGDQWENRRGDLEQRGGVRCGGSAWRWGVMRVCAKRPKLRLFAVLVPGGLE